MRVLILSCNTGEGHNSCSKAIQKSFQDRHITCELEDSLFFVSTNFSKIISWIHTQMYRYIPTLFQFGYQYAEKHNHLFTEDGFFYKILTSGSKRLYRYILDHDFDIVICTHVFSALIMTDILHTYHPNIHTAFVATDYTCSPSCGESNLDVYFIPDSSLSDAFINCGISEDKIIASGIPIHQDFLCPADKITAKKQLGLSCKNRHLLIMIGSMGCGPIKILINKLSNLLTNNCHVSVICGTNVKLRQTLERKYANYPNIHIYGFRKDIAAFMESADLYLTKPGGISTSEAARKRLPMILINAVAGCETYNLNFFVSQGAAVTARNIKELVNLAISLLSDTNELDKMSNSYPTSDFSPAEIICDYFLNNILYNTKSPPL